MKMKTFFTVMMLLLLSSANPAWSQPTATAVGQDRFQVVLTPDSNLALRGVRALRVDTHTGQSWILVGAGGFSVAWKPFASDPSKGSTPQRRSLVVLSVLDTPDRGVRSMLLDKASGETWWHETRQGGEEWVPIKVVN